MNSGNSSSRNSRVSRDWPVFRARLARALSEMREDQFLVVSDKNSSRFVQFAAQGSFGVRAEISSNAYLSQSERLTDVQTAQLVKAGWSAPTGKPRESTPERDPDGSPNFFINYPASVEAARIANQAIKALSRILRIPHPQFLQYDAFDTHGNALTFSQLGIKRSEKAEPADMDNIAKRLLSAIREITNLKDLEYDKDGDIGLSYGSITMFVRATGDPPLIRFYAPLVQDVRVTRKLCARLNKLNSGIGFMHFFVRERTIFAISEITASPMQYAVLAKSMRLFSSVADGTCEELKAEFGRQSVHSQHIKSTMIH